MIVIKRVFICTAILIGVFLLATFIGGFIADIVTNAKYEPDDKDRKYESMGNAATAIISGLIAMCTLGIGIVVYKIKRWHRQQ